MVAPLVEELRRQIKQELIEAIQSAPWDDDTMYEVATRILGKEHVYVHRLKALMEEEFGPIMDG